jgi:hypothetical protein
MTMHELQVSNSMNYLRDQSDRKVQFPIMAFGVFSRHFIFISTFIGIVAPNELQEVINSAGIASDLGLDLNADLQTVHVNFDGLNISTGQTFSKDQVT